MNTLLNIETQECGQNLVKIDMIFWNNKVGKESHWSSVYTVNIKSISTNKKHSDL